MSAQEREWQPGDKAYIEVEVTAVLDGLPLAAVKTDRSGTTVRVESLRPVPAGREVEAATEDVIERARVVARKAVADEFYAMQGGDPEWEEAPEPNAGDDSVGNAVVRALAAAGLLAGGAPGRSEAETEWGVRYPDDLVYFDSEEEAESEIDCYGGELVRREVWHGPWRAARVAGTTEAGDE